MTLFLLTTTIVSLSISLVFTSSLLIFGCLTFTLGLSLAIMLALIFTQWLGITVAIVYLGGLMVMFAYFLAICPNQRTDTPPPILTPLILVALLTNPHTIPNSAPMQFTALYQEPTALPFLGGVLFFTLIAVVNLVERHQGPLRPFKITS